MGGVVVHGGREGINRRKGGYPGLASAQGGGAVEMGEDKHKHDARGPPRADFGLSIILGPPPAPSPSPLCDRLNCSPPPLRPLLMDEAIPSISTEGVGSRFVSQNDIEAAKARRDEQWRAAYARHVPVIAPISTVMTRTESIPGWARSPRRSPRRTRLTAEVSQRYVIIQCASVGSERDLPGLHSQKLAANRVSTRARRSRRGAYAV